MKKVLNYWITNWKTTSAGITTLSTGITGLSVMYAKKTWSVEGVAAAMTAITAGVGFLFTRDATVTSVDMGLQDVEKKGTAKEVVTPKGD